jgi:5S rRNA maturation endonuclease (ribonuclease M5)
MRAPVEVRLERFEKLIERVSHESEKGSVIVVEGQRDRESLRRLGITGRILCLQSSRKNTVEFVEDLDRVREVVVLTDFDRQGVFLAKRLARILTSQRIQANLVLWRSLRELTRSDVRSVEELSKFYQRLWFEQSKGLPLIYHRHEVALPTSHKRELRRLRKEKYAMSN